MGSFTRLLPSEQRVAEIAAGELAHQQLSRNDGSGIRLEEPCNCGSNISHNNGGNYHAIVTVVRDDGRYFIREDTTCELVDTPEWEEIDHDTAVNRIVELARRGYEVYPYPYPTE